VDLIDRHEAAQPETTLTSQRLYRLIRDPAERLGRIFCNLAMGVVKLNRAGGIGKIYISNQTILNYKNEKKIIITR